MNSHCLQCGHCCKVVTQIYPYSERTVHWAMTRGLRCVDSSDQYLTIEIPSRCPHLGEHNECKIHDDKSKFPETCDLYPSFIRDDEIKNLGLDKARILGRKCGYLDTNSKRPRGIRTEPQRSMPDGTDADAWSKINRIPHKEDGIL